MTDQSTELIWHFIGYLHIEELLQKSALHFAGAYVSTDEEIFTYGGASSFKPINSDVSFNMPAAISVDPAIPAHLQSILDSSSPPATPSYSARQLGDLAANNAPAQPYESLGYSGPSIYTINLTYVHGDSQSEIFTINQGNSLINIDQLLSSQSSDISAAYGFDPAELLIDLVENAQESLSELSLNPFDSSPETIAQMLREAGETAIQQRQEDEANPPLEQPEPIAGKYTNGEKQPIEPSDNGDQQTIDEEIDPVGGDETTNDQPETLHITTNLGEPTGGAAQINNLGANESTNTALMADYSDSYGSIIVAGDVFATNTIIQANILHDDDAIGFSGTALVGEVIGDQNTTTNTADFIFDNLSVTGNPALGYLPAGASWNVTYVDGDVYDISILVQENLIVDNDIAQQTATNTHFTAATGANAQTNEMLLFEYGETYDLIIIGGNLYEFNAIVQYNILLDDDLLELSSDGSSDTIMSANAGENVLTNDASIINIGGGDRFQDMNEDAQYLAEQVGDEVETFDSTLIQGLPGNGSPTFNVLYISGDLYDVHAIYQINVMSDMDVGSQELSAGEAQDGDPKADAFTQEMASGGNELTNTATIYDVDSTSNYQFLGGQYYEDSLLIQTEMVTNDDDISFDDEAELIATTVAILTGTSDGSDASAEQALIAATGPGTDDDMLGGVLS